MITQSPSLRWSDRGRRKWDGPEIERPWLVLCQNNDRFTEIKVRALWTVRWCGRDLHQCNNWKCLSGGPSKILIITAYPCSLKPFFSADLVGKTDSKRCVRCCNLPVVNATVTTFVTKNDIASTWIDDSDIIEPVRSMVRGQKCSVNPWLILK